MVHFVIGQMEKQSAIGDIAGMTALCWFLDALSEFACYSAGENLQVPATMGEYPQQPVCILYRSSLPSHDVGVQVP